MEASQPLTPNTHYNWRFENFYKSRLIQTTTILTLSAFALSRFYWTEGFFSKINWKATLVLAGIVTLIVAKTDKGFSLFYGFIKFTHLNRVVFEILLLKNVIKNRFGSWEWTTKIDENIYISALPLREMGIEKWIKRNNIAVLSINERYELETTTLGGRAIDFTDITHKVIESEDFLPLSLEKLNDAANWINARREEGRKVLINCKSGVGRSVSAYIAFREEHRNETIEFARRFVANKRPFIIGPHSNHMKQLENFATLV